ncbi:MAG: phosphoribosylformylglycinamidine cyclo-ligase [Bacteroidetes bacterium]|nr:phosphoribosylformylglycinamidine cyclo-ligase [Bacteroidota bacterium]
MEKKAFTYKDSGVDVKAGEELVNSIKEMIKETHNVSVLSNIGGFGGLFRPNFTLFKDPVLVSSVDGVGTKLIVAFKKGVYNTVGQDLVNHCVNDIAVCGAEPLFFLDYFSTGRLNQAVAKEVIKGFTIACRENECALIGGETAEMPDIYSDGEFDLAGTIVGVVDKESIFDGSKVTEGDVLIGFSSTGLHTNGYSLARKVLLSNYEVDDYVEELGTDIGSALLAVHKSYLPIIRELKKLNGIHAFSHITGGGIIGNTKRVVPAPLKIEIDWNSWERPALFKLIAEVGNIQEEDQREAFNLGIGLIVIVSADTKDRVLDWAKVSGEKAYEIGKIVN